MLWSMVDEQRGIRREGIRLEFQTTAEVLTGQYKDFRFYSEKSKEVEWP